MNQLNKLFFVPSFYLFCFFNAGLLLYFLRLLPYPNPESLTIIIFFSVSIISLASMTVSMIVLSKYKISSIFPTTSIAKQEISTKDWLFLFLITFLGFFGLFGYLNNMLVEFGGLGEFLIVVAISSADIRAFNATYDFSIFTQLTYFSFLAFGYIIYLINFKKLSAVQKTFLIFICLLIFLLNLLYIDRTRPVWILWIGIFLIFIRFIPKISFTTLVRRIFYVGIFFLSIFVLIGLWIGKIEQGRVTDSGLPSAIESPYSYFTGGYSYFNQLVVEDNQITNQPMQRFFYPVLKLTAAFGLSEQPPSQINEHKYVGVDTNIGTFLEPFFQDGGFLFCILGILIHTFFFDALCIFCLSRGNFLSIFFASNIFFCNVISFFTPKISSVPIFIFFILFIFSLFFSKRIISK